MPSVLITGCSSGIGRATAEHLARKGFTVWATARKIADVEDLAALGCKTLALDVTNERSMQKAVTAIEKDGGIDALVNNAGYSQSGAIETVTMELVRRQFETNVFGLVRLTQLVLPGMRARRRGRIVNVSSMGGKLTFPGGGYYHASKHAVEAVSDALRFEVKGFGIGVIVIEPGLIRTQFGEAVVREMQPVANDPYGSFNNEVAKVTADAYKRTDFASKMGSGPEAVAKVIEKAITKRRPRTRYRVTPSAKLMLTFRAMMSDRMWDRFVKTQFPQPKP